MATAAATGRQIMQRSHSLRNGSAFAVHAAKCGSEASSVRMCRRNHIESIAGISSGITVFALKGEDT